MINHAVSLKLVIDELFSDTSFYSLGVHALAKEVVSFELLETLTARDTESPLHLLHPDRKLSNFGFCCIKLLFESVVMVFGAALGWLPLQGTLN